ncbi:sugar phosphate permease [Kribbella pratensis]|uniref:Sugar phosphate permease n=1 Tax=Kribbella pratensis TaxID=2512112 RepID=A0ABY2FKG8_9ACTN|nr:MFS transporter [Kribbella pratensis]TDW93428.1 sugar phosphate permease [Kribbella pratensis]
MYLSSIDRPHAAHPSRRRSLFHVSGNVFALGAVSLITDISSEMVTAVLPVYLMIGLHLSPAVYGVVDGTYTGATALLRLVGGYVADRTRRRKFIAGLGYGFSAVAKLGLPAAGNAVGVIGAVIAIDRTGKGLRTAPRDALITLSTPPQLYGRAFGVHRMMDTVGAFAGPLVALGILAATGQAYDAVFVASFCIAAFGVLVLVLFVRDRGGEQPSKGTVALSSLGGLLRIAPVRRLVLAACLAGMVTIGDGFVYLLLQRREDLSVGWFPLLAVGTNLSYLLLATPLGVLADKIGRQKVVLAGYTALMLVYLLLFGPFGGWPLLVVVLALYGLFYASTDGVLIALAGPVLPTGVRTTGIALIQTGQAMAYLVSSVLFGLAWTVWGPASAIRIAAVLVAVAVFAVALLLRGIPSTDADEEQPA